MPKSSDALDMRKLSRFENRSTNAIVATILNLARSGIKKTHIMYKANLSYSLLKKYVGFLKDQGLVEERESSEPGDERSATMIYTTRKGRDFLEKYRALAGVAGDIFSQEPWGRDDNRLASQEDKISF
jgi:predicted transcriptional regulator